MRTSTFTFGLAAALALAGCEPEDPGVAPSAVVAPSALVAPEDALITDITGHGPGCPPGSLSSAITPDRTTFIVFFSNMRLSHPPGPALQQIDCAVDIGLHVPPGWQLTVATIDTRGFAHLPQRVHGVVDTSYFLGGVRLVGHHARRLQGPFDSDYTITDHLALLPHAASRCGEDTTLTIDAGLMLDTSKNMIEDAFIDTETADGKLRTIVTWHWRRC